MTVYEVRDPRGIDEPRSFPTATDTEIAAAVAAADRAHPDWGRRRTVEDRTAFLRRVAELHRERSGALAAIISTEMGKSSTEAREEVEFSASIYDYYADCAAEHLADEPVDVTSGPGSAYVKKASLGPILGIMPWNFPVYQVARFAAPNLAIGNTILLKHAPQCPESAAALQDLFMDAGLPDGVYVNVYATNAQIGELIADPRVHGVSLTGSERAGAAVAELAGRHLKKVVLELGGSDPFIVLNPRDIDATVDAAIAARMGNAGQACNAGKRFIVLDEHYDEFVAKFTAQLAATPLDVPLVSGAAAGQVAEMVADAVADGARAWTASGTHEGAFHPAVVLEDVSRTNRAFHKEFFGPVSMMFRAASEDEAVAIANDTPFGLGSYVFTDDLDQAVRVADRLEVGMVFINGGGADGPELPFGGVKRSGFGRELGRFGLEEFVNKKLVRLVN